MQHQVTQQTFKPYFDENVSEGVKFAEKRVTRTSKSLSTQMDDSIEDC